jgi:hypothetical protein
MVRQVAWLGAAVTCLFCLVPCHAGEIDDDASDLYQQFRTARLALSAEGTHALVPFYSRTLLEVALSSAIRASTLPDAGYNRERYILYDFFGRLGDIKSVYDATAGADKGGIRSLSLRVLRQRCSDPALVTIEYRIEAGVPRISQIGIDTTPDATSWFRAELNAVESFPPYADIDRVPARMESFQALGRPYRPFKCPQR